MKHILIFLFSVITLSAFGQAGSLSQSVYRSRVLDSATVNGAHSSGYGDFFWNAQATTPGWRVWNGSSYDIGFSSGGSFWPLAGSAPLTGQVEIDGAQNLWFGQTTPLSEFRMSVAGTIDMDADLWEITSQSGAINFTAAGPWNVTTSGDAHITAVDTLQFSMGFGLKINNNTGSSGQVLTSNGGATPPTWQTPTTGVTAPGSTGNVPFKSAGGGFQAETALSYDSATNTLDADIVTVNDDAYSAGWSGSAQVPTKNSIWNKIETVQTAINQASTSTAGATITFDFDSRYQAMFYGSASFSTAKAIAIADTTNAVFVDFYFEVTNSAATLTPPTNWYMADSNYEAGVWTPPVIGIYELAATKNLGGNYWSMKIIGPIKRD